jgi:hypothetical protein
MRRLAILFLLCGSSAAEDKLFLEPSPGVDPSAAPGWRARFAETLSILETRLGKDALDADAYEQAATVLSPLGRDSDLIQRMRKLVKTHFDKPAAKLVPMRRCLGHILVEQARGQEPVMQARRGWVIFRVFGNDEDPEKLLKEAIPHLRAALARNDRDVRSKGDLAYALERLKVEESEAEVARLRRDTVVHAPKESEALLPEGADRVAAADKLRNQALALETAKTPDFVAAEPLRRQALANDFCTHTIPFEFDDSIFPQISLLAEFSLVSVNLTRHYKDRSGEDKLVPPDYHPPSEERRLELVRELAQKKSSAAAAAMLALLRRADMQNPVADAALAGLVTTAPEPVKQHLPQLLAHALQSNKDNMFTTFGMRYLVRLAEGLHLEAAAPVLREQLVHDTALICPLDIAIALGKVGRAEDADALVALANDRSRDVYFRRRAVDAVAQLAPERLQDIKSDPLVSLSLAAGFLPHEKNREKAAILLTRILDALSDIHQADDAAAYCAQLEIKEALPILEAKARELAAHYSGEALGDAYRKLRAKQ